MSGPKVKLVAVVATAALTLACVLLTKMLADERERSTALQIEHKKHRAQICHSHMFALEKILERADEPGALVGLHLRMTYAYLDPHILDLCIRKEALPGDQGADCWIMKGDERCYLDVARRLLEEYRLRALEFRHP